MMALTIRVFRANTGSCGGCDAEIILAVAQATDMEFVSTPIDADVWLLTGILSQYTRNYIVQTITSMSARPTIIAVGQCALNGAPFGRGGIQDAIEIPVKAQLDGCPPSPAIILAAIRNNMKQRK
jgi:Ni,Fe-hydrogenase III small subunit